jgi:hypothetical protein
VTALSIVLFADAYDVDEASGRNSSFAGPNELFYRAMLEDEDAPDGGPGLEGVISTTTLPPTPSESLSKLIARYAFVQVIETDCCATATVRTAGNTTDRPGVHADVACDVAMGSWRSPFLGVRPTRAGRRFVDAALKCETAKASIDSRKNGPVGHAMMLLPQSDMRRPLLSPACLRDATITTTPGARVCSLENPSFQMHINALDKHGPAKTGLWPATVAVDLDQSPGALQAHGGLWSLSPDGTCPVEAPPQRPVHPIRLPWNLWWTHRPKTPEALLLLLPMRRL